MVSDGAGATLSRTPLLLTPCANTETGPLNAPGGTTALMRVSDQLTTGAASPLMRTCPDAWLAPKCWPVRNSGLPTAAVVGDTEVSVGGDSTEKDRGELSRPFTRTRTEPLAAPGGTVAVMVASDQLTTLAPVPAKLTVLGPCAAPKNEPVSVTVAPTAPAVGARLVNWGGWMTVNACPLLVTPLAPTLTRPDVAAAGTWAWMVVALQLTTVALVPLNVTVP